MLILLLQVILIVLRLDNIVDWPWMLVMAPMMATLAVFLVFGPPFSYSFYEIDAEEDESN